ncbi:MAG: radical SAM protein [Desulfurococcales archaeon]|nr:radical SAM protein [Desulfurococcales archaeon]
MPAYGFIAFGIIDRGTNVLQVRPTTICPLNCIFCSVDAGPYSIHRWAEYIVKPAILVNGVLYAARYKGGGLEALIDTIGDPLTYPYLIELIRELRSIPYIRSVAVETHGALLSYKLVNKLEEAGLSRINLSIDTLSPEKAKFLQGMPWFDLDRVIKIAEYVARETNIDLHVTPIWIPGINDKDVEEVIKWAIRIGAGKKWPPVTIQKYNIHKYGRKVEGIRPVSWRTFWKYIEHLERRLGVRLHWSMKEWGMRYLPRIPIVMDVGDIVGVRVIGRGWLRGEYLGISLEHDRLVTIAGYRGKYAEVLVRIVNNRDGIYIGKYIGKP